MRFEVLSSALLKIRVFWDVTPCQLVDYLTLKVKAL
jgi:hypothetical protein